MDQTSQDEPFEVPKAVGYGRSFVVRMKNEVNPFDERHARAFECFMLEQMERQRWNEDPDAANAIRALLGNRQLPLKLRVAAVDECIREKKEAARAKVLEDVWPRMQREALRGMVIPPALKSVMEQGVKAVVERMTQACEAKWTEQYRQDREEVPIALYFPKRIREITGCSVLEDVDAPSAEHSFLGSLLDAAPQERSRGPMINKRLLGPEAMKTFRAAVDKLKETHQRIRHAHQEGGGATQLAEDVLRPLCMHRFWSDYPIYPGLDTVVRPFVESPSSKVLLLECGTGVARASFSRTTSSRRFAAPPSSAPSPARQW
eukprot:gene7941-biopygen5329